MSLLEIIEGAGIVGCGGAGFPTHVKLGCQVEYLIINGAECEPLLRTDRYLMLHKAPQIIQAVEETAKQIGAEKIFIALKCTYKEEIASLTKAIQEKNSSVHLYEMKNFYPAGDEQIMVCDVTGRTVPPAGIPLDVGAVVSNIATMYAVSEAMQGKNFTHKYLTVTGEVAHPTVVYAPLGAGFEDCIQAAGGALLEDYMVIAGGPLMGKLFGKEEARAQVVSKTTSGIILLPKQAALVSGRETPLRSILNRAKSACIQCSNCTEMCPRYLTGHPLRPHKIMRKLAYNADVTELLEDFDIRQAQICSECGVCETFACPMGLHPRQVNVYVKQALAQAKIKYQKSQEEPVFARDEREYRRIPSKRIAARLGVVKYYDYQIDELKEIQPSHVEIPLRQHIGAPSEAVVKAGEKVVCGQLIGKKPQKALGANIHASIDGTVVSVGERVVIERRETK